ncbi:MAG: DUF2141 domain-containing protein [Gemmatimonadaceae bacterium]|nr:DUF2141 domain-containing protein [Gemmatimonadaceae bacterium]
MLGQLPTQPGAAKITVRLQSVRPNKGGLLRVSLHRESGVGFPGPSPLANAEVRPAGVESVVTFDAVPGAYAVAVHHDANANGKMDSNLFGIPKEGYGMSNDPRPRFRAPRFAESRVLITRDTTLIVRMVY